MFLRRSITAVAAAIALCAVTVPASAAGATAPERAPAIGKFRYWAFWEQHGKGGDWSYATKGPSVLRPEYGAVLGFRFTVSDESKDVAKPRGVPEFKDICGDTDAGQGRKLVALSIDFGTPAHAPRGEKPPKSRTACARVADDATAADALADVAKPLRYDSAALLCAIDGYPKRGCGEQISDTDKDKGTDKGADGGNGADKSGERKKGDDGGSGGSLGSTTGIAAGLTAVAALAFAAVRLSRRRK